MKELTLGADPEGFLYDKAQGRYVTGIGIIGGTKESPLPVPGGAILEDNVTAEFNTEPVLYDDGADAFVKSIAKVRDELRTRMGQQGLELHYKSAVRFRLAELVHQQAQESGCDPDYNIYSGGENEYPSLVDTSYRYSGGHIHVGHPLILKNPKFISLIVKSLDASVGTALILKEGKTARTKVYGALGNFRPKPYGLEYRSASNIWVDDEELMKFVHEMVLQAMMDAVNGTDYEERNLRIQHELRKDDVHNNVLTDYMHSSAYQYGHNLKWW